MHKYFLGFNVSSLSPSKFCSDFWRPFAPLRWTPVKAQTLCEKGWGKNLTSNFVFVQNQNPDENSRFSSFLSKMSSIEKSKILRCICKVHSAVREDNIVFRSVGLNPGNLKECWLNWSSSKEIWSVTFPKWKFIWLIRFPSRYSSTDQEVKFFSRPVK